MQPRFSLIVPTKDRGPILLQTVQSALGPLESLNGELILVNDGREDLNVPAHPRIRTARNPKGGVASARNFGASLASAPLLLFMDDDFLIDEEAIALLLGLKEREPDHVYLLNWHYPPGTEDRMRTYPFGRFLIHHHWTTMKGWMNGEGWEGNEPFEIKAGASYLLLLPKAVFERSGGYNEGFPHAGAEDHEFCQRLIGLGQRFFVYPAKVVYHNESDRAELKAFLQRRRRNAVTQRFAASIGRQEVALSWSPAKRLAFRALMPFRGLLRGLAEALPNQKTVDPLYGRLVSLLIALYIFDGYHSD